MDHGTASKPEVALIARAVLAYLSTDADGPVPALGRCFVTLALGTEEPPFVVVNDTAGETLAVYQVRDIGEGKTMLKRRKSRVGVLAWPATAGAPARLTGYAWGGWATDSSAGISASLRDRSTNAGISASLRDRSTKNTLQPEGKKRRTR